MNNSMEPEKDYFESTIDVRRYLDVLIRWWRLIALCTLLGIVAAYLFGLRTRVSYEATAMVAVARSAAVLNFDPKFRTVSEIDPSQYVDPIARRRSLIVLAASPEVASRVLEQIGEQIRPSVAKVDNLSRLVQVTGDGELIEIHVRSTDPAEAALIANAWTQQFERLVNQLYTEGSLTPQELVPQIETAKQTYDTRQSELALYLAKDPELALTLEITRTKAILEGGVKQRILKLDDLFELQNKVERVLTNAQALRIRLASGAESNLAGANLAGLLLESSAYSTFAELPVTLQIPLTQFENLDRASQQAAVEGLITALETQRQELSSRIQTESKNLLETSNANALEPAANAQSSPPQDQANQAELHQKINELESKLEVETAKKQELTAARDLAWETYSTLASKLAEANVAEQSRGSVVRVATRALVPTESSSSRSVSTLLGGAIGLLIGIVFAFVIDFLAGGLSSADQVKTFLALPTLAIMPKTNLQNPSPLYVESLRELRHQLSLNESRRVIMFASANPDEGTSDLIAELATTTAHAGKRVLLVDANLRNSTLSQRFGITAAPGLADLLQDPSRRTTSLQLVMQKGSVENLTVVPAGTNVSDPTALLETRLLTPLLEEWKKSFDLVLVNAPPILGMIDAAQIGRAVDGVVLVVDRLKTPRSHAQRAQDFLAENGAMLAGVVLTRAQKVSNLRTRLIQLLGPQAS